MHLEADPPKKAGDLVFDYDDRVPLVSHISNDDVIRGILIGYGVAAASLTGQRVELGPNVKEDMSEIGRGAVKTLNLRAMGMVEGPFLSAFEKRALAVIDERTRNE